MNSKIEQRMMQASACCQNNICSSCPYTMMLGDKTCKKIMEDYRELSKTRDELERKCEDLEKTIQASYENGAEDAWMVARRIFKTGEAMFTGRELIDCFGLVNRNAILTQVKAVDAIEKLRKYESEILRTDIKVGDILVNNDGLKVVVTEINGDDFSVFSKGLRFKDRLMTSKWSKTGESVDPSVLNSIL